MTGKFSGEFQKISRSIFVAFAALKRNFKKDEDVKLFCLTWHSPPCIMINVMVMLCL